VLDGAGEDRVGDASEGTRCGVLRVRQLGAVVTGLEPALCGVEGAELDGDTGADSDQRCECSLVEGEGTLVLVDCGGGVDGGGVLSGCLESDLDDVKRLAYGGRFSN
jgi:hypothetical protein